MLDRLIHPVLHKPYRLKNPSVLLVCNSIPGLSYPYAFLLLAARSLLAGHPVDVVGILDERGHNVACVSGE